MSAKIRWVLWIVIPIVCIDLGSKGIAKVFLEGKPRVEVPVPNLRQAVLGSAVGACVASS